MTTHEATERLTARYRDQVAQFPRTALIPESLYVRRNMRYMVKIDRDAWDENHPA